MLACQGASVTSTSLSPKGNTTIATDVLEITEGVVNTCPAVLRSNLISPSLSVFLCAITFSSIMCWKVLKIKTSSKPKENFFFLFN